MEGLQEEMPGPMVSVVMPTVGRSSWLREAVESALGQSYRNCEVVVVDDSRDWAASGLCGEDWARRHGERLRVIQSGGAGGGAARNAGVRAARGEWIAFLDDDDAWMPEKLEKQMAAALDVRRGVAVVSCRVRVRTPRAEYVYPRRVFDGNEPIGEYLFCRRGWREGSGFMQTSTLLAPRLLLLKVPFTEGLPIHQDWDWLLRASLDAGVRLVMLDVALAVYRTEDGRATVSRKADWRTSLDWVRVHKKRITPRAFSWFVAVQCVWKARAGGASAGEWAEIARAFCFEGRPTLCAAAHFAAFALVPAGLRKRVRNMAWGTKWFARAKNGGGQWRLASR
jgi:glycosyltransferase involved in cell wall biosynthesis